MASKQYKVVVRLSNGNTQTVSIVAESYPNAKAMAEAQFGVGNVVSIS
jgi:hypothetical protein